MRVDLDKQLAPLLRTVYGAVLHHSARPTQSAAFAVAVYGWIPRIRIRLRRHTFDVVSDHIALRHARRRRINIQSLTTLLF